MMVDRAWSSWGLKLAISLGIAAAFGYWVHNQGMALVPSAEQLAVVSQRWWLVLAYLVVLGLVHFLRAYRWLYLLRPIARARLAVGQTVAIAFVGFMAIMVLPLRTGELVRPYLVRSRGLVTMSKAFGTIAIERVFDGLVLSGTLTFCLLWLPIDYEEHGWARYVGILTLGLFVTALAVLLALLWVGERAVDFLESLGRRIWPRGAEQVARILREFVRGLAALPDRRYQLPFFVLTLIYWGLNGLGMWLLSQACGLSLSLLGAFTVMTMLGVGILVPTGPGHFGNFQAAAAAALTLQYLPSGQFENGGAVFVFLLYVAILGTTVGAGVVSLLAQGIGWEGLFTPQAEATEQSN